ncbi:hypothetical protein L1049_018014 [Liquidambar formosana]|uniref:AP2/ERF domain-containing protein n=1 Tax=Liquidambar formosana TaxID=63359 RepID=A0AAP0N344_LIQFO
MVKPSAGQQPAEERSDSRYKGVRKRKWGKWVSEIRLPNSRERIWLGSYDSAEKAARAFDAALYCLRGRHANFNFPENPPDIVGGETLTPSEIQAVATRFANGEEPPRGGSLGRSGGPSSSSSQSRRMEQCASSSSLSDGTAQVVNSGDTTIDWSFLNTLDNSESMPDFGLFHGLDNMPGDLLPPPEEHYDDDNGDENGCGGFTSQHSFLWNF